jgi:hypothetical protein
VYVAPEAGHAALRERLRSARKPALDIVTEARLDTQYVIAPREGSPALELMASQEGLVLWSGLAPEEESASSLVAQDLLKVLDAEAGYRALLALARQPGRGGVNVSLRAPSEAEIAALKRPGNARMLSSANITTSGPPIIETGMGEDARVIVLEIDVDEAIWSGQFYVAVLGISAAREVALLYPTRGSAEPAMLKDHRLLVNVSVYLDQASWPREEAQPNRYLVLVTRDYADCSLFEGGSRLVEVRNLSPLTRGTDSLPPVLAHALFGATRGSLKVANPEFSVGSLDVMMVRQFVSR